MKLLSWLRSLGHSGDSLENNTYVPLLTDDGKETGAIIVHSDDTKNMLIKTFEASSIVSECPHNGSISEFFCDQIAGASGLINATMQSGKLLQVVGRPELLNGLKDGTLSILKSSGQMTGTVVSEGSKQIVGQLRFAPASCAPIVAPMAAWQILNAVAGVAHLKKINARLDSLQRGIERLTFRQQAKTLGQLIAAIDTLEDLSNQLKASGTFTNDMLIRLALADRDIQAAFVEQRFLVQRFTELTARVRIETRGKEGAVRANQILKEEAGEFLIDAKILTTASKASLLSSQAWLHYDLEHNPRNIGRRLTEVEEEVKQAEKILEPLTVVAELDQHAKNCVDEMGWFSRKVFDRSDVNEIKERSIQPPEKAEASTKNAPTVLMWKVTNNTMRSVIIDSEIDGK